MAHRARSAASPQAPGVPRTPPERSSLCRGRAAPIRVVSALARVENAATPRTRRTSHDPPSPAVVQDVVAARVQTREAAEQYDEALHQRPDVLDTLAVAYAAAGRFPEAFETVGRALAAAQDAGQSSLARD